MQRYGYGGVALFCNIFLHEVEVNCINGGGGVIIYLILREGGGGKSRRKNIERVMYII